MFVYIHRCKIYIYTHVEFFCNLCQLIHSKLSRNEEVKMPKSYYISVVKIRKHSRYLKLYLIHEHMSNIKMLVMFSIYFSQYKCVSETLKVPFQFCRINRQFLFHYLLFCFVNLISPDFTFMV